MLHVITGGSASGKSEFAETVTVQSRNHTEDVLYYIATMQPYGDEGAKRVQKHRAMRAGKGFETLECYVGLDQLFESTEKENTEKENTERAEDRIALLECMSNLLANEQFQRGGSDEDIIERIRSGILHLKKVCRTLVVVTNEVFSDGICYEPDTMRYLRLLGSVNRELAQIADTVTEVVYGIPVPIKGDLPGRMEK